MFDDSKLHYAENKSNEQRVVLIVDIERPYNIKRGTSSVEETSELMDIINQMKIINDTNWYNIMFLYIFSNWMENNFLTNKIKNIKFNT